MPRDSEPADVSRLVLAEQTKRDAIDYWAEWPAIPLDGLVRPLANALDEPAGWSIPRRHHFSDALTELQRLLDEVQFGATTAFMLLRDFAVRHPSAELVAPPGPVALPVEVLALLAGHISPTRPFLLTQDLHSELPGPRHLSRWLAGQLLDSSLVRAVSALDRLAVLLELGVSEPKLRNRGEWFAPTLTASSLQGLSSHYAERPEWENLTSLIADEVTVWIREHVRNAFIHRRRWPSALSSEAVAIYSHMDPAGQYVRDERAGLSAPQHLALVRMTWEVVLSPATAAVAALLDQGGRT